MTDYSKDTDDTLLKLLRDSDQRAFRALYERHWNVLWSYARNAMADPDDAEDIVQELFMTLWEKREVLDINISLKAYLYRATLNKVIDRSDRTKYRFSYLEDLKRTYEQGKYSIDETLFEKELRSRFEACVGKMPPKMRTIFTLSRTHLLTHQQISDYLNISRDNVNRQIKNALILLKKSLLFVTLILKYFLP
ncbi:DNA-directed RNA polymerase sigma-70 factor [Parapedobacter pyrenivorans]|uniref:DNA-directed RNA polymerase sigma-70 factor n=1 Tax=Parapedobacter pyrenivorans TaxID=1305674 RepID=A0A917HM31_9SPHI|nr:RNA polymerase sigma-70 factor [Parapedobacter pyrenivorans]GGG84107.1 DNA-directed RNA polymerase sigma-70 factor [Parapedobacter pyrenivorans]